jgi:hypothetical protein
MLAPKDAAVSKSNAEHAKIGGIDRTDQIERGARRGLKRELTLTLQAGKNTEIGSVDW